MDQLEGHLAHNQKVARSSRVPATHAVYGNMAWRHVERKNGSIFRLLKTSVDNK